MPERVRITTESDTIEGVVIPDEESDHVTLKLDSGYNIGIDPDRVKDVTTLEEVTEEAESASQEVEENPALPDVALLHTGGTIASRIDYETGAVVSQYDPEDILALFPEIHDIANIETDLLTNISSELMRFAHYNLMIDAVAERVAEGVDGIIITHGTDTMHYSSAALSFALENVPVPVLFVGSQRSSDRPSTDAYTNLVGATRFIAETEWAGVGICMHAESDDDSIWVLPGCKARKMHTSRRDAFRPINARPVGRVEDGTVECDMVVDREAEFTVNGFDPDVDVGWVRVHPNLLAKEIPDSCDGLLMELFALGHAQTTVQDEDMDEHEVIADRIDAVTDDIPVVGASQCLYGRMDMDVYSPGRHLQELGVVGNHTDMTPETGFVKLAWLLSQYDDADKVRELYCTDLRGEISDRLGFDEFLQ